jgi:hypothetical protein
MGSSSGVRDRFVAPKTSSVAEQNGLPLPSRVPHEAT